MEWNRKRIEHIPNSSKFQSVGNYGGLKGIEIRAAIAGVYDIQPVLGNRSKASLRSVSQEAIRGRNGDRDTGKSSLGHLPRLVKPSSSDGTNGPRARAFLRQGPEARRWMHGGNGTRGRDRYRHSVLFHFGRATSDLPLIGSTPDTR